MSRTFLLALAWQVTAFAPGPTPDNQKTYPCPKSPFSARVSRRYLIIVEQNATVIKNNGWIRTNGWRSR